MSRQLPRSTLFPYTTLFRSRRVLAGEHDPDPPANVGAHARNDGGGTDRWQRAAARRRPALRNGLLRSLQAAWPREDARSEGTRLNSSHVRISYAVFCLKKKT